MSSDPTIEYDKFIKFFQNEQTANSAIDNSYLFKEIEKRQRYLEEPISTPKLFIRNFGDKFEYGNFPEESPSKYNEEIRGVNIDLTIIDDLSFKEPEEAKAKKIISFDPKDLDI